MCIVTHWQWCPGGAQKIMLYYKSCNPAASPPLTLPLTWGDEEERNSSSKGLICQSPVPHPTRPLLQTFWPRARSSPPHASSQAPHLPEAAPSLPALSCTALPWNATTLPPAQHTRPGFLPAFSQPCCWHCILAAATLCTLFFLLIAWVPLLKEAWSYISLHSPERLHLQQSLFKGIYSKELWNSRGKKGNTKAPQQIFHNYF